MQQELMNSYGFRPASATCLPQWFSPRLRTDGTSFRRAPVRRNWLVRAKTATILVYPASSAIFWS